MEDADTSSSIDNTDFQDTDVPFKFNIPDRQRPFLNEAEREAGKPYILNPNLKPETRNPKPTN
jgi:hypothetical protein